MSYADKLRESAARAGNIVCMGLDPVADVLPQSDAPMRERLNGYFSEIFHRMRLEGLSPAAFKPNIGYYAMLDRPREEDFSGSLALADILEMLETFFPGIPVILDSKRGDIARSSGNYAAEAFECWGADAVTVSPYMGNDSVFPFAYQDKGVYILNRTSNPGAKELQNEVVLDPVDEKVMYPLYHSVAMLQNLIIGGNLLVRLHLVSHSVCYKFQVIKRPDHISCLCSGDAHDVLEYKHLWTEVVNKLHIIQVQKIAWVLFNLFAKSCTSCY